VDGDLLRETQAASAAEFPIGQYQLENHWWLDGKPCPEFISRIEAAITPTIEQLVAPVAFHNQLAVMGADAVGLDAHVDFGSKKYIRMFPRFQLLAGLFLADTTVDDSGNLFVSSGSHLVAGQHFAKERQDRTSFEDALRFLPCSISEKVAPPETIYARAGDMILMHSLVTHGSKRNRRLKRRDILYYRFGQPWAGRRSEVDLYDYVTDPWKDWRSPA